MKCTHGEGDLAENLSVFCRLCIEGLEASHAGLCSQVERLLPVVHERDALLLQIETLKNEQAKVDGRGNCSSHACLREKPKGMGTNSGKCYCTQGELRRFIEHLKVDKDSCCAGTEVLRVKLEESNRLNDELAKLAYRFIVDRGCTCNEAEHRCGTNQMLDDLGALVMNPGRMEEIKKNVMAYAEKVLKERQKEKRVVPVKKDGVGKVISHCAAAIDGCFGVDDNCSCTCTACYANKNF